MIALQEAETRKPTFVELLRLQYMSEEFYGKHVVLVEGPDDVQFYSNLVLDNCFVKKTVGCKKLIEYHLMMNESWTDSFHIAIKDADFDRANGTMVNEKGFFYTDCHDHEMMAASSDAFMTDLLAACGSTRSVEDVRNAIFADLHVLSMFRWYNHTEQTQLNCRKGVDIVGASVENLHNPSWLLAQYMNITVNKRPDKQITTSLSAFNVFCSTHSLDDFELTNGHNFISRFCGVSGGDMRVYPFPVINDIVQTYYQVKYFKSTHLYSCISAWEVDHVNILRN